MKTMLEMGWDEWDNSGFPCLQRRTTRESSMFSAFECECIQPVQSVSAYRFLRVFGMRSDAISYIPHTCFISVATYHDLSIQHSASESGFLCLLANA